jgi:hypothetical protein
MVKTKQSCGWRKYVERLERYDAAVFPPVEDRYVARQDLWNNWARWGAMTCTLLEVLNL